jgi:hypothetical protein
MARPATAGQQGIPGPGLGYVLVYCALPILVGGLIYLAFRDTSLLMFRWAGWIGMDSAIEAMRVHSLPHRAAIPDWVLFSVPDGVWVFACTAFFARLWHDGHWAFRVFWIGLGPALAIGGELGQLPFIGLVPGTFDPADLLFYIVSGGAALWLAQRAVQRARARLG